MSDILSSTKASYHEHILAQEGILDTDKYPPRPIHQQMKYTEPETKSSCCGRTKDQIMNSQGGRMSMTLDPARVTCKPYGADLNKAWQRLTDELEAARCR